MPETERNGTNKSPEIFYDENSPSSRHNKRNIKRRIELIEQPSNFEELGEMKWEVFPASSLPTAIQPNVEYKTDILKAEDVQSISSSLSDIKVTADQSYMKLQNAKLLFPDNAKSVFQYPTISSEKKILKGSNISGSSKSKYLPRNPFIKTKANKVGSASEPSKSKSSVQQLELPLTKQKIAETFQLAEACRFLLVFLKSKRMELRYMESQLDYCTTELQQLIRSAELISFKLEATPETVPEELSAAKVQSQKLSYLLSISHRNYLGLSKLGSVLQDCLDLYSKEAENFHLSIDRLLEYIIATIIKKSRS